MLQDHQPAGEMILLVDDHDITRKAIAILLRRHGYDVRVAPTGHAALNFLRLFQPDAVVLDLALPDMSGIDVLRRLRSTPFLADTPVLVFSGNPDDLSEVPEVDADMCILKGSVSWETLLKQISRLTGSTHPVREHRSGA